MQGACGGPSTGRVVGDEGEWPRWELYVAAGGLRTWRHVAGIKKFHCGLNSFQGLLGHTLEKEGSPELQHLSREHSGPMVSVSRYVHPSKDSFQ